MNPLPPPEPAAGLPTPPAIVNAPPTGPALLSALKRRWEVALFAGPAAAAVVAAAIWFLAPPGKHTAVAKLELNPVTPNPVLRPTGYDESNLENFRQLQMTLLKSQKVVNAALRDPKLAQLGTLQEVGDPMPWLDQWLTFNSPGGANVLEVKLQGNNADDVRMLLNGLVKTYIADFISAEQVARSARLDALRQLDRELDNELRSEESTRRQFSSKGAGNANIAALQATFLQGDMNRLKTKIGELENETAELETRGRLLDRRDPSKFPIDDKVFQEFFLQDPALQGLIDEHKFATASLVDAKAKGFAASVIDRLKENEATLLRQVRERQQELRPQAEEFWRRRAASDAVREVATINETLDLKRGLLDKHRKDLERYQKLFEDLSRNQTKLDDSQFKTVATGEMLQLVQKERKRLEGEHRDAPRVREIEEARLIPFDPADRKLKLAGLGGGLALVLMLAGLAFWEFKGRRLESVDQIVYGLGLPLVGTVPAMPRQRLLGLGSGMSEEQLKEWRYALQEAVATARTVLLNASRSSNLKSVMITSAMAGEGKTSLSVQLAVSLAMAGHRTLLLDFDLRNPSAHKMLGLPHTPGWADVLRGELNVADAVKPTSLDKLAFIPAGDCDPGALRALAQDELGQVLNWLRSQYDFMIIDTCPVLPVVDALLLGRHVDGVIFSVLHEVSQIPKVYIATQRVAQLGIRTLGAVVNGVRDDRYYGTYGYGQRGTARPTPNAPIQAPRTK